MMDCVNLLRNGSIQPQDAITFLRAQILFWVLQAPDGHAKNFSIQIHAGGGFQLTPIYDVLSAYPISGHGRDRLPAQQIKMAMAVIGKNRHYRWKGIQPRHWLDHGTRMGLRNEVEQLLHEIPDQVDQAIDRVSSQLPKGFPSSVGHPITDGASKAISKLRLG